MFLGNLFFRFSLFFSAKEVTKRSIRLETWQKIKDQKLTPLRRFSVFNKIPNYIGAEKAAELLAETEEFKKASKY